MSQPASATASLAVSAVNDAPVVTAASLTLNEGETRTLAPANFAVADPDNASFDYTVRGVSGGYFQLSSATGTPITTFTSADLAGGLVQFVDDGNELAPAFSVTVYDGALISNTLVATVTYTPVNDAPTARADFNSTTEETLLTVSAANAAAGAQALRKVRRVRFTKGSQVEGWATISPWAQPARATPPTRTKPKEPRATLAQAANPPSRSRLAPVTIPDSGPAR